MLDVIIPITSGCVGLLCGWFLHIGLRPPAPARSPAPGPVRSPVTTPPPTDQERDPEQLRLSAERLRDLTLRVAADVDAHQSSVQRFSDVLTDVDPNDGSEGVLAAVEQLAQANRKMQQQLSEAHERMQKQAEELQTAEERAATDGLTKLRNRRALDDHLDARFELRDAPDHPTSFMLLDVDHFKAFNDTHGHRAGDEVLRQVAALLQARLSPYGVVARYGGEEFAVVFDDLTLEEAIPLAEQARAEIGKRLVEFEGASLRVTASGGLAQLDANETLENWLERADMALYQSKEAGRDQTHAMNGETHVPIALPHPLSVENATQSRTPADIKEKESATKLATHLPRDQEVLEIGREMIGSLGKAGVGLVSAVLQCDQEDTSEETLGFIIQHLHACVRGIDRVGILATDELAIWMPSTEAEQIVDRLSRACREIAAAALNPKAPVKSPLTVSIGVAMASKEESVEDLLERAREQARHCAEAGGNGVRFEPSNAADDATAAV